MRQVRLWPALLILAAMFAPSASSEGSDATAQQDSRGALLYRIHCQNCHGDGGTGDGPMAKMLTINPSDLTRIRQSNDGDFPVDEVRQAIDGRTDVRAHGTREMPVWGLTLQQSGCDSAQEDETEARMDDLVNYLESIQVED